MATKELIDCFDYLAYYHLSRFKINIAKNNNNGLTGEPVMFDLPMFTMNLMRLHIEKINNIPCNKQLNYGAYTVITQCVNDVSYISEVLNNEDASPFLINEVIMKLKDLCVKLHLLEQAFPNCGVLCLHILKHIHIMMMNSFPEPGEVDEIFENYCWPISDFIGEECDCKEADHLLTVLLDLSNLLDILPFPKVKRITTEPSESSQTLPSESEVQNGSLSNGVVPNTILHQKNITENNVENKEQITDSEALCMSDDADTISLHSEDSPNLDPIFIGSIGNSQDSFYLNLSDSLDSENTNKVVTEINSKLQTMTLVLENIRNVIGKEPVNFEDNSGTTEYENINEVAENSERNSEDNFKMTANVEANEQPHYNTDATASSEYQMDDVCSNFECSEEIIENTVAGETLNIEEINEEIVASETETEIDKVSESPLDESTEISFTSESLRPSKYTTSSEISYPTTLEKGSNKAAQPSDEIISDSDNDNSDNQELIKFGQSALSTPIALDSGLSSPLHPELIAITEYLSNENPQKQSEVSNLGKEQGFQDKGKDPRNIRSKRRRICIESTDSETEAPDGSSSAHSVQLIMHSNGESVESSESVPPHPKKTIIDSICEEDILLTPVKDTNFVKATTEETCSNKNLERKDGLQKSHKHDQVRDNKQVSNTISTSDLGLLTRNKLKSATKENQLSDKLTQREKYVSKVVSECTENERTPLNTVDEEAPDSLEGGVSKQTPSERPVLQGLKLNVTSQNEVLIPYTCAGSNESKYIQLKETSLVSPKALKQLSQKAVVQLGKKKTKTVDMKNIPKNKRPSKDCVSDSSTDEEPFIIKRPKNKQSAAKKEEIPSHNATINSNNSTPSKIRKRLFQTQNQPLLLSSGETEDTQSKTNKNTNGRDAEFDSSSDSFIGFRNKKKVPVSKEDDEEENLEKNLSEEDVYIVDSSSDSDHEQFLHKNMPDKKRRNRIKWSEKEEEQLYLGVQMFQEGNWHKIISYFRMKRKPQHLYDKWRNLLKYDHLSLVASRVSKLKASQKKL